MVMNRHRAAAIHLALSAGIVLTVLTLLLLQWYPDVWFAAMGGRNLLFILGGVDIVIGPLLTWIVFQPGKKTLKFDLSVIASLQIAALIYGLHVMYEARPAFMVFMHDQFRAVAAAELEPELIAKSRYPEFRILPTKGPRISAAELPSDPKERQTLALSHLSGIDLHMLPQFWIPYDGKAALRTSIGTEQLRAVAPENVTPIEDFLRSHGKTADQVRFLPLRTRHKEMAVVLDAANGDVLGVIDAKPWR